MARIFITGSSDGIGLSTAKLLSSKGHTVILHARNADRAATTQKAIPSATVLIADLRSISETKKLGAEANALGPYDSIIHNAGIGFGATSSREITADKISAVFAVNTLAPYILTCVMDRPKRLLYMSSDSHYGGDNSLRGVTTSHSYGDSKLHDMMLANGFARRWGGVQVLSMHPGWVRTKMGGSMAPGGIGEPTECLAEWAVGEGRFAGLESGTFFSPEGVERPDEAAGDLEKQDELLRVCGEVSGVGIPE
jgi:NAD(P)-dependent dehydrogenase (short-subunit alcohol dehydrogenase family)